MSARRRRATRPENEKERLIENGRLDRFLNKTHMLIGICPFGCPFTGPFGPFGGLIDGGNWPMLLIWPPGPIGGTPRDWCGPANLGFIGCIEGGGPTEKRERVSRYLNRSGQKASRKRKLLRGKADKNEYHTLPNKITITLKGSSK